jgi:hypothetical protein
MFYNIDTWGQCYKTFLFVIYEFSDLAKVLVRLGWKACQEQTL